MDFSDEPYVRKYTRKTLTWKLLGWEGRAVLDAMLGEFDAAGIFAIRGDAATCISAVTDIPLEVVRLGLQRLVETETWVVTARVITWPSFEEAQNCRRSDRLRQRESRRARSAQSVTDVTARHSESQTVTASHPPSLPPSAPIHPSHPPESPERARAPDSLPEVPGLVKHPGPLQPSKRERREAQAAALTPGPTVLHEMPQGWWVDEEDRAYGRSIGLTDEQILERAEHASKKHYPSGFTDPRKQFHRDLLHYRSDAQTENFKRMNRHERDRFENPGRDRATG